MPEYLFSVPATLEYTVEADTEEEARELAHANINSFEVEDEYTSEWNIESVEEV